MRVSCLSEEGLVWAGKGHGWCWCFLYFCTILSVQATKAGTDPAFTTSRDRSRDTQTSLQLDLLRLVSCVVMVLLWLLSVLVPRTGRGVSVGPAGPQADCQPQPVVWTR